MKKRLVVGIFLFLIAVTAVPMFSQHTLSEKVATIVPPDPFGIIVLTGRG